MLPQLDQAQLNLWLTVLNTVGVIAALGYGLRLFLRRTLVTKAELDEREAIRLEERKRLEVDRDAWRKAAETATANNDKLTDEFGAALDMLRHKGPGA